MGAADASLLFHSHSYEPLCEVISVKARW